MYPERKEMYDDWEKERETKVMLLMTGDRKNLETQLHPEVLDFFAHHLDIIGDVDKITLFLYTRGGHTLAAWSICNLIRQFCDKFEIIIPAKAHSAGTLMSLGADSIMMTKQATLGPIDPSVSGPLNPTIPGAPPNARAPVSVEAITGFLDFAKNGAGLTDPERLQNVFLKLCDHVHPLILGEVYRSRTQIRMLGKKLIQKQIKDEGKVEKILQFLCSESGSHDYTINRREAKDDLGLSIEKPTDELYEKIKKLHQDCVDELQIGEPFSPEVILGAEQEAMYSVRRCLLESCNGGSHVFISEGRFQKQEIQQPPGIVQTAVQDERTFEGWRHEHGE